MKKDNKIEFCECNAVHSEVVNTIKSNLAQNEDYIDLSEFFKAYTDPTRLKILTALKQADMCVCDLVELLELSQPLVSHHLRILKSTRLIKYRKSGKFVYYSLDDNHIHNILQAGMEHLKEE